MENPDGTATCDRDATPLDGYGILYGLVTTGLDFATGTVVNAIYCYAGGCADHMLRTMNRTPDAPVCTYCSESTVPDRSPVYALLGAWMPDGETQQSVSFCHANGCSSVFLGRIPIPE